MYKRILAIAPHVDDVEFGAGGTINKLNDGGREIFYVAFSCAEKSVPRGMPKDVLKREVKDAMRVLGLPEERIMVFNYPVREFPKYRQEILEDMIKIRNNINPDFVLLPSTYDTHQDHQVITNEGIRAFKKYTIFGYEMPWNNILFQTTAFVLLEEKDIMKKIEALNCYNSQKDRPYASEDFILSLAKTRGIQIGFEYAEAFEIIRFIMK